MVLGSLGNLANDEGDYAGARPFYEESLAISRDLGNRNMEAVNLMNLGNTAARQGDFTGARPLYEEARRIWEEQGNSGRLASALLNLANASRDLGEPEEADRHFRSCLALCRDLGEQINRSLALEGLAGLALDEGQLSRAARLLSAADALREQAGVVLIRINQEAFDHARSAVRGLLGEDAFAIAWEAGRTMTPDQAIAYALEDNHGQRAIARTK